jgi:capsular exopolysaccharide synthesis family protein
MHPQISYSHLPEHRAIPGPPERALAPAYTVYDVPPAAAPTPAPVNAALDQLVRRLWRSKFIIAGIAILGAVAGVALSKLQTPSYRAITTVQLEGINQDFFLRDAVPVSPMVANATAQNYLENQVKVLESYTLASRVAQRLQARLQKSDATSPISHFIHRFVPAKTTGPPDFGARVQKSLTVRTSLQSQVMEIAYDDPDPGVAAAAANQSVEEFISMNREARWQLVEDTALSLNRQTNELKAKLEKASADLQQYARSSGLVISGGGRETPGEDRMRQLEDALAKAVTDRVEKQSRYEAAVAGTLEALPDGLVTGPLHQYQTDLETAKRELADALALYTPAHYKVQRLQAQVAELEAAITAERKAIISRLQTEMNGAVRAEHSLQAVHDAQLHSLQAETEKEAQYEILKREVETTQHLYDSVLERVREAGVASALGGANIRVIDRAMPPHTPRVPDLPLGGALGFALGTIGAIGLVLLRDEGEKMMRPEDLALAETRELGVIPSAKQEVGLRPARRTIISLVNGSAHTNGNGSLELATWHKDSSWFAESFRAALASILFNLPHTQHSNGNPEATRRGRALVITSAEPSEGKTCVVTNLAIACAETGRRVLVIDADLRRPRMHDIFNVCNDAGLADLVQQADEVDSIDLKPYLRTTSVSGLFVLPSGPGMDGISGLLYSAALHKLLMRFRNEFDLVLVDSPPMMLYSDARVLGRASDGVVLVVRANRTNREQWVRNVYRVLTEDRTPILGTILNDFRAAPAQYKKYSDYYRRYNRFSTPNGGNPL